MESACYSNWGKAETKLWRIWGAISPAIIVASLGISRIVGIGTYSILCDFGAYTSFYFILILSILCSSSGF